MFDPLVPNASKDWEASANPSVASLNVNIESADGISPLSAANNLPVGGASHEAIPTSEGKLAVNDSLVVGDPSFLVHSHLNWTSHTDKSTSELDALFGDSQSDLSLLPIVEKALQSAYGHLKTLATDLAFSAKMNLAFGESWNAEEAIALVQELAAGKGSPPVEILPSAAMNGANGAFASLTNTIYLSNEYIAQNTGNPEAIANVLLEEIGHYIDSRIDTKDAPGDEGAIFAALVIGQELTQPEILALKAEDDTAAIALKGKEIVIEQSLALPQFSSNPSSTAKIYLDFDGNITSGTQWNTQYNSSDIVTPAYSTDSDKSNFSTSELTNIEEICKRVAEDFAPFNIDVTTINPGNFNAKKGLRVCIGGAWDNWYNKPGSGGVAYPGSWTWGNTPVFVFAENRSDGNPKSTADAISHEVGHAFGLDHQGGYDANGTWVDYNPGSGSGDTGWVPIMGNDQWNIYPLSTWHNGQTSQNSTSYQDDMAIIAETNNGFGYRTDDRGNTNATAQVLSGSTTLSGSGIISTTNDVDVFSFTTKGGAIALNVNVASVGPNLDVLAELRNSSGTLIASNNPTDKLSASINSSLAAGTYYLHVKSNGSYGRVGQYTITGLMSNNGPDFNADGKSDILWRNYSNGQNQVWFMNGTQSTGGAALPTVADTNWRIESTGDFNADGKSDIVWRNYSNGQNQVWFMNGTQSTGSAYLTNVSDLNWRIESTGDFNSDGKTDILWRNYSNGQNQVWFMNGTQSTGSAYLTTVADTNWRIQGAGDFNSDGKTDIFWRNYSNGQNQVWFMNGTQSTGSAYLTTVADTNWQVSQLGDFNADGKTDIAWRNYNSGQNQVWLMNGTTASSSAYLTEVADNNWQMSAQDSPLDLAGNSTSKARNISVTSTTSTYKDWVGNLDTNDYYSFSLSKRSNFSLSLNGLSANADVQLLSSTGSVIQNAANAGTTAESMSKTLDAGTYLLRVYPNGDTSTNYNLNVTAAPILAANSIDFNADGKSDILWRNYSNGQNQVWFMNGTQSTGSAALPTVADTNWRIESTGDFNADGKSDIVWRNYSNGQNQVWFMNGTQSTGSAALTTVSDLNWRIESTGDFNADGKTDILWRNYSNGQNQVWFMNGTQSTGSAALTTVADTNWRIQGAGDFNSDGKTDIFWRNYSNGQNQVWLMNGTQSTGSAALTTVADTNWQVSQLGDFNADGKTDIAWRNYASGQNQVWLMNGTTVSSSAYLTEVADNNWQMSSQDSPLDLAGNTTSKARNISVTSTTSTYKDWVGNLDTNDYYSFSLSKRSNFSLSLNGLSANADVQLLSSTGSVIQNAANAGTTAESMSRTLDAGTYLLRVYPNGATSTNYNLNLSATSVVDKYEFIYYYGNGDSYQGFGYADSNSYSAGQYLNDPETNSTGYNGFYYIGNVSQNVGSADNVGKVYISDYYDGDVSYQVVTPDYDNSYALGTSGLGSEYNYINSTYLNNKIEIDALQGYEFTYYYGNGDSYYGNGYTSYNQYYAGQYIGYNDGAYNETGNDGYYYISAVAPYIVSGDNGSSLLNQVFVSTYYDGDASGVSYTPYYYDNGSPSGSNGLGNEYDYIYNFASGYYEDFGSDYYEADAA